MMGRAVLIGWYFMAIYGGITDPRAQVQQFGPFPTEAACRSKQAWLLTNGLGGDEIAKAAKSGMGVVPVRMTDCWATDEGASGPPRR